MPGRPFGILEKSSRPSCLWSLKWNGQWSVETICRSSAASPVQSSAWFARGQVALHEYVDRAAVLSVQHDQAAVLGGSAHRPEDCGVVEHEDTGIGHEQLERGDPFLDKRVHLGKPVVVQLAYDNVEAV